MGNKHIPKQPQPTPQALEASFQYMAKHQAATFTKVELLPHLKIILHSLRISEPIQKRDSNLHINPSYLKFIFSPYFSKQMMKCVQLLISLLEQLNGKSLSFLKIEEVISLTFIADFIIYFSNQKILENFDSLLVRSDVCEESKQLVKQISKLHQGYLQVNGNIVQKMNNDELQIVEKCLRITIMNFINLRLQPLSRSETTLKYFFLFEESLFMLYTKLYITHHFSAKQPNLPELNQHFKSNLTIGSYFLSAGSSYIHPSLYQTAVVFLCSFLKLKGVQYKEVKSLPSHMFKGLPIVATNSMYQYLICNLLYTLKYIKQNNQTYLRFGFNRIQSLHLVQVLLQRKSISNKTITYYLQELCLQVKIGQIQRACVSEIVQKYIKLNQTAGSEVFRKFLELGKLKYNLKFTDRQIKISKQELLTQLQDDQDSFKKQYYSASYRFVLEKVLFRAVTCNFNDKQVWQQILPNLMNNKEDENVRQKLSALGQGQGLYQNSSDQQQSEKKQHISVLEPEDKLPERVQQA